MYYFYRYAPFVVAAMMIGTTGFIGYKFGEARAKHATVMNYLDIHKACREKIDKELLSYVEFQKRAGKACGSFTMYSFYYDAVIGNCVWNEVTR